jgi:DNA polymerase-3 subunit delta'
VTKFTYAEKLAKDKDAMRQTIMIWLSYWRDVMLRTAQAETPIINMDRNMEIEFLALQLDLPKARRVVSALERALEQLDRNVNGRLLAEVLLLDWPKVGS